MAKEDRGERYEQIDPKEYAHIASKEEAKVLTQKVVDCGAQGGYVDPKTGKCRQKGGGWGNAWVKQPDEPCPDGTAWNNNTRKCQ